MEIFNGSRAVKENNATLIESATNYLNETLKTASGRKVLLLLSGGSSLPLLDGLDTELLDQNNTIAPLDERFSTDPQENNMAQIANMAFFEKAKARGVNFIDTRVLPGEDRDNLAERFNNDLKNWISGNPDGKIIATIGIGSDGHISGIMTYPEDKEYFATQFDNGDDENLVVGYDAGDKNPYPQRVTTTMNFLRKIDTAVVYVVGDNKKDAVMSVLAEEGDLPTTPARIIREINGKVMLFTDISK